MVTVTAFGIFRIEVEGADRTAALAPRFRRLLAHLALRARPVDRRVLSLELWPEADAAEASSNLRRHLYALDAGLASAGLPGSVVRSAGASALAPSLRGALDVARYVDELAAGQLSEESLRAYREPLFPGDDDEWLTGAREDLRARQVEALSVALERSIARRNPDAITALAAEAIALDPLREDLVRRALTALAEIGEPARARSLFATARRKLRELLDVEPDAGTIALAASLDRVVLERPALPIGATPFFGRRIEVARGLEALRRGRAATLVGAPGVGKSRVAWEIAREAAGDFARGVRYLDASVHASAGSVRAALADGLFAIERSTAAIVDAAARSSTLLVFDNCDRYARELSPLFAELVGASAQTALLLTSRNPLRFAGERVMPVEPFALPPATLVETRRLRESEALAFLLERAAAAGIEAGRSRESLLALADIARELDGLPLALELAALALGSLGVEALRAVVADRFGVLRARQGAVEHHVTLGHAFEWSYERLTEPQRRLFRALGLMHGRWTLARIATYCEAEQARIAVPLSHLVESSLVRVDAERSLFSTLRSTRDYMHRKLVEAGELREAQRRYAAAVLEPLVAENDTLRGARAYERFAALDADYDDIRAALDAALVPGGDVALAAAALNSLSRFMFERGHTLEALGWYDRILALLTAPSALRSETLYLRALLARNQVGFDRALAAFEEAIAALEHDGDPITIAKARLYASNAARMSGDADKALTLAGAAASTFAAAGDAYLGAFAQTALAAALYARGQLPEAGAAFERALVVFRSLGARGDEALILVNAGRCQFGQGLLAEGVALFEEGLARAQEARNVYAEAHARISLALAALDRNDGERARPHLLRAALIAADGAEVELSTIVVEALSELFVALGRPAEASTALAAADAQRRTSVSVRAPTEEARCTRVRLALEAARVQPARDEPPVPLRVLLSEFVRDASNAAGAEAGA
jgi:predicted ATPase/DNA-binding SARP family transcriptional activator